MSLTNEDRAALVAAIVDRRRECRRLYMFEPQPHSYADVVEPVIEQIVARHVAEARAATWDEVAQALAWATDNGPDPVRYIAEHNPYRTPPP